MTVSSGQDFNVLIDKTEGNYENRSLLEAMEDASRVLVTFSSWNPSHGKFLLDLDEIINLKVSWIMFPKMIRFLVVIYQSDQKMSNL